VLEYRCVDKNIYQILVEIIYKINDLLNKDFEMMSEMEIEYNYLLVLNHVYDIQLISDLDPN
jgi:hypothetical protein